MLDEDMPLIEFTAEDRCDKCGAQAYTLAKHEQFGELLFCNHDLKVSESNLLDEGWMLISDTERMANELTPSYIS